MARSSNSRRKQQEQEAEEHEFRDKLARWRMLVEAEDTKIDTLRAEFVHVLELLEQTRPVAG